MMFQDKLYCFGVLGNCGEDFVRDLLIELEPLWTD
jgi:hypothetical protein